MSPKVFLLRRNRYLCSYYQIRNWDSIQFRMIIFGWNCFPSSVHCSKPSLAHKGDSIHSLLLSFLCPLWTDTIHGLIQYMSAFDRYNTNIANFQSPTWQFTRNCPLHNFDGQVFFLLPAWRGFSWLNRMRPKWFDICKGWDFLKEYVYQRQILQRIHHRGDRRRRTQNCPETCHDSAILHSPILLPINPPRFFGPFLTK